MSASSTPIEAVDRPTTTPAVLDTRAGGRPESEFSIYLDQALSSYARRSSQTAFLLSSQASSATVSGANLTDEEGLRVWRNAQAGYVAPIPEYTPAPEPISATAAAQPATAGVDAEFAVGSASSTDAGPAVSAPAAAATTTPLTISPMSISDFPRPANDNGMGIHWIPTVQSSDAVVDTFVAEAVDMGMKWVVFLNDGTNIGANDYLVKKLVDNGIEPVLRVFTNGLEPISGDLGAMVTHYRSLGVDYYQLYNEPNLMVETHGQTPDVNQYLDLWIPAAKEIIAAGGLPGFGALSPQGEVDDRQYLAQTLAGLKARGEESLLDRSWLSVHNYTGPRDLSDPDGFLRFRQYDTIIRSAIGRSLPMVGCEGGTQICTGVDEQKQAEMMLSAWDYMETQAEPYMFAYTYWIIANEAGGGKDKDFTQHALITESGPTALASALKSKA